MNIAEIQLILRKFAKDRDWEKFHSPKNLVMALSGEVGELTEIFQWLTEAESKAITSDERKMAKVREEIADVMIYLLKIADLVAVDMEAAVRAKIAQNEAKYPVALSKGKADKYTELR
jgi:dCTP diphosphatase